MEQEKKKKRFISIKYKIEIAEAGIAMQTEAEALLKQLARENNVHSNQIKRYIRDLPQLRVALERRRVPPLTMHVGPVFKRQSL